MMFQWEKIEKQCLEMFSSLSVIVVESLCKCETNNKTKVFKITFSKIFFTNYIIFLARILKEMIEK